MSDSVYWIDGSLKAEDCS